MKKKLIASIMAGVFLISQCLTEYGIETTSAESIESTSSISNTTILTGISSSYTTDRYIVKYNNNEDKGQKANDKFKKKLENKIEKSNKVSKKIYNHIISSFSNYGINSVDAVLGEDIFSTIPCNYYGYFSGTSMEAAFVSGEAFAIQAIKKVIDSSDFLYSSKDIKGINISNSITRIPSTNQLTITDNKNCSVSDFVYQQGSNLFTQRGALDSTIYRTDIYGRDMGTLADVNGDERADYLVVWKDSNGSRNFTSYLSQGNGTFSDPINTTSNELYIPETTGRDIGTFADVTGDGKADYIVPWSNGGGRYIATYISKGDGTFNELINTPSIGCYVADSMGRDIGTFADVTGDGKTDYVVPWNNGGVRYIATYVSKGDGTFYELINTPSIGCYTVDTTGRDIGSFADVTGDGKADYIVPWSNGGVRYIETYISKGDGTFNELKNTPSIGCYVADTTGRDIGSFADVTGDGKADYIVPWNNSGLRYIATYVSKGDGMFYELINSSSSKAFFADLTGKDIGCYGCISQNSRADYLVVMNINGYRKLFTYLSNGDGTFKESNVSTNFSINLINNKEFDLIMKASNIKDFSRYQFTIKYNIAELELLDLCSNTSQKENSVGLIADAGIGITYYSPGTIILTINKPIPSGMEWSGTINTIRFKSKINGQSSICICY